MKSTTDRRLVLLALLLVPAALAYACSGDDTVTVVDAGTAETYVPPPPPPPIDAARDTSTVDSGPKFDAGSNLSASNLLINEVSGGDEWVELVNIGADPEDISGIRLADRDKTTGEPKLSEAVMFPPSTVVQKGGYVIVRGGGTGDAGRPCPDGGQSHCFNAEFGISNKSGETLFLLAKDGGVLGKVVYPPDASSGATSWSRLPSGDPDAGFETAPETPGAPNRR
jgi:hypothetical protein